MLRTTGIKKNNKVKSYVWFTHQKTQVLWSVCSTTVTTGVAHNQQEIVLASAECDDRQVVIDAACHLTHINSFIHPLKHANNKDVTTCNGSQKLYRNKNKSEFNYTEMAHVFITIHLIHDMCYAICQQQSH